jgi:signal transduction histidine kinase
LSRLDQGKGIEEATDVDVAEVVRGVVERAKQDPWAAKITLQSVLTRDPGPCRADQSSLDELVGNLVDNAVRYTPAGGLVTVEVDATESGAVIFVRDTGPGIAEEDREHIFEPFYRGHAQKNIPGTGLGLPIVKRIAERHGGRVEVRTAPGEGTEFRVFLPRAGARAAEELAAGRQTRREPA